MTWQQQALAPCLAGPPGTVTSFLTAAALAGVARAPVLPHVIVPPGTSARLPIAKVHTAVLAAEEVTRLFGIPCTTLPRTIVDCSRVLGTGALTRVVDDALHRDLVTPEELMNASIGRPGRQKLLAALDDWIGPVKPGSAPEVRLQRQLRSWGFPRPERQHPVLDQSGRLIGLLDLAWPDRLVGVEYDSDEWHDPRRWKHDESRHAAAERMGWQIAHADKIDLRAGERRLRDELDRLWHRASHSVAS